MNDMQIHLTQMPVSVYLPASPSPSSHWVVVQIGGAPIHRTLQPPNHPASHTKTLLRCVGRAFEQLIRFSRP